jgi:hypothetical protein
VSPKGLFLVIVAVVAVAVAIVASLVYAFDDDNGERRSVRSGIPDLDLVIDAVLLGHEDTVEIFLQFEELLCGEADPDRPRCPEDLPLDSLVPSIWTEACERRLRREDEIGDFVADLAKSDIYAAFPAPAGFEPPSDYIAVFFLDGEKGAYAAVRDGRIVAVGSGCDRNADEWMSTLGLNFNNAVVFPEY